MENGREALTLDEVHDLLRKLDTGAVVWALKDWHPAILGQLHRAIHEAKKLRTGLYHGHYFSELRNAYHEEQRLMFLELQKSNTRQETEE